MNSSSNTKAAWILVPVVAIFCYALFTYVREDNSGFLDAHTKVLNELQGLLTDYNSAVLNHEGYWLTGENSYLRGFKTCTTDGNRRLLNLRTATVFDPNYAERFRTLEQKVRASFDQMTAGTTARIEQGARPAIDALRINRTTLAAQEIYANITDAETLEARLLQLTVDHLTSLFNLALGCSFGLITLLACAFPLVFKGRTAALEAAEERLRLVNSQLDSAKAQLDRLANVDFLTEVLNVRGLQQALLVEENRAGRVGGQLIAILVNCDNFRKINEQFGHAIGDVVLKELAKRISGTLRPSDQVARVGGDEFLIVLPDTQLAYAMRVAERIRTVISDGAVRVSADLVKLTVSIGVASLPINVTGVEDVVNVARAALKRSKGAGKNRISLAREGQTADEEPATAKDIVEVLCDGAHFRTVFQPIIDLATEDVSGYEIYSRGPDGAFESPAEFFKVCIENNILTTVDLQCLKACIATTNSAGNNLRFHINLFPSTILDTPIETLISLFPEDRNGRTFCIEISEQQFVGDPGYLREHVNALKQSGILVAIDDVGFGRSSLESLILLEPDLVKVDRKYVNGVSREPAKARLLRRVVNVAKSLGAEIVAEGIEVKDDLPILKEIGVHYGQGWYWGELLEVLPTNTAARTAYQPEKR